MTYEPYSITKKKWGPSVRLKTTILCHSLCSRELIKVIFCIKVLVETLVDLKPYIRSLCVRKRKKESRIFYPNINQPKKVFVHKMDLNF